MNSEKPSSQQDQKLELYNKNTLSETSKRVWNIFLRAISIEKYNKSVSKVYITYSSDTDKYSTTTEYYR